MVRFGGDERLYVLGLDNRMRINSSAGDNTITPYRMEPSDTVSVESSQVYFEPWLVLDARSGDLLLSYTGRHGENIGIMLKHSSNQGEDWSYAVRFWLMRGYPSLIFKGVRPHRRWVRKFFLGRESRRP